jgi:hypothetical protein
LVSPPCHRRRPPARCSSRADQARAIWPAWTRCRRAHHDRRSSSNRRRHARNQNSASLRLAIPPTVRTTSHSLRQPAYSLAITLDRQPLPLRSTRNRLRTAVRRSAGCHGGSARATAGGAGTTATDPACGRRPSPRWRLQGVAAGDTSGRVGSGTTVGRGFATIGDLVDVIGSGRCSAMS